MNESNGSASTPAPTITLPQPTVVASSSQENKTVKPENGNGTVSPGTVTVSNATPIPQSLVDAIKEPVDPIKELKDKPNEQPKKEEKNGVGRPTVMTDTVLAKLRTAFLMGCSDREATAYADISNDALYDYQNAHPDFTEQKEKWKQNPILKARQTVFKGLENDETAKWFLERKKKDEFSLRQELTGADNQSLQIEIIDQKPKQG